MSLTEKEFDDKLKKAIVKFNRIRRNRKLKRIPGFKTLEKLPSIAKELGFDVEEMQVFHKITDKAKDKAVYVSRNGSTINLLGFTIDDPAVTMLTEEERKRKHLGRILAKLMINLPEEQVVSAFVKALEELKK